MSLPGFSFRQHDPVEIRCRRMVPAMKGEGPGRQGAARQGRVGPGRGPGLLPARFPGPLAESAVRLSTQRARTVNAVRLVQLPGAGDPAAAVAVPVAGLNEDKLATWGVARSTTQIITVIS